MGRPFLVDCRNVLDPTASRLRVRRRINADRRIRDFGEVLDGAEERIRGRVACRL
jgi:hypothetical protein